MIRFFRQLASGLALVASCVSSSAHAEWLEATTKHFIVVGNTGEGDLRRRALRLEQFDAAMRFLVGGEEGVKVHLYLLETMGDVQRLADNSSVGGFYSAAAQEAHAFMPMKIANAVRGFTPEAILFHEYTHHMLLGSTTSYTPRWATEGLAEMFMTAKLADDGSVTIGTASAREENIKALHRWTVEEMLRKDAVQVSADETVERYSRGWALCHYLWMSGQRPGQYVEFIRLLNKSGDQVKAAQQAFGDLKKLDAEVGAYIRRSAFNVSKLSASQIKPPTEVTIRHMSVGESAMMMYRLKSARGVDRQQAELLFAQAKLTALRYPSDAVVQGWFAEMAMDAEQIADADQAADRALAADPKIISGMIFKGRVAARRAIVSGSADDWKVTRSWFLRANRIDPNNPYPFQLFYDSYSAAGQAPTANAVTGLYRAVMLMPQDMNLRVRASMELLRSNEVEQARVVLAPVAFNPHRNAENPAKLMLAEIDAGKPHDTLLERANTLQLANVNDLLPPSQGGTSKDNSGDSNTLH